VESSTTFINSINETTLLLDYMDLWQYNEKNNRLKLNTPGSVCF